MALVATDPPAPDTLGHDVATEKAYLAEQGIAWIRFLVIAFNIPVYYLFVYPAGVPWLALAVSIVAGAYAVYVPIGQPYRRYPVLTTSLFTVLTDSALIVAWLVATGGSASPFHYLWFVSLFAVAFRYQFSATIAAAGAYILLWWGIALLDGGLLADPLPFLVEGVYMAFVGGIGGFLARETYQQVWSQASLRREVEAQRRAAEELGLLRAVTDALGRAKDLDEALQDILDLSCRIGGWTAGQAWVPAADGGSLVYRAGWYGDDAGALRDRYDRKQAQRLAAGEGLPGQAWQHRGAAWVRGLPPESGQWAEMLSKYPPPQAARNGAAAVAIPLEAGGDVVAVLVFFLPAVTPKEERLVEILTAAVQQVGPMVQRRQAETRYRTLSDASMEGVAIEEGGIMLEVNRRLGEILGYESDELVGQHVTTFIPPEELERVSAWIERAPQGPQEVTAVCKDGSRIPLEFTVQDFPYQGRMARMATIRDVSERKRVEDAQRLAMEREMEVGRLEEVNAFKTNLLNTTSHELNTPLTPLKLQLHLLRSGRAGELSERQARAVDILGRNVDRLAVLVQDVLDVARLQSHRMRLKPETHAVEPLLREAVEPFEDTAAEKGLELEWGVEDGLRAHVDRDRFIQVLVNLISNAIKFTAKGRVRIQASGRDDGVLVTVSDTGLGMTAEDIGGLFQPFTRMHEDEDEEAGGTGLGLYITKGIVEEHGGRVWVESPGSGKGTTFYVLLPDRGDPAKQDAEV